MKQLLILSGKGGTGKTTLTSAFIYLAQAKVYADCDIDAPNLHLVIEQAEEAKCSDFYGMGKAEIDESLCIQCGLCYEKCQFDAIMYDTTYEVNVYACEGCGVCEAICPTHSVTLKPAVAGELRLYTKENVFSTAELKMGSGTSGKLVTEVKKQMREAASETELAIIDGSPGIGCPVIASLSGVDMVLVVAEPSISGISDMERIIKTAHHFQTKVVVCVNKYDMNIKNTQNIEAFCKREGIPFVGRIPFDTQAVKAVNAGKSIAQIECKANDAIKEVFSQTMKLLLN